MFKNYSFKQTNDFLIIGLNINITSSRIKFNYRLIIYFGEN